MQPQLAHGIVGVFFQQRQASPGGQQPQRQRGDHQKNNDHCHQTKTPFCKRETADALHPPWHII